MVRLWRRLRRSRHNSNGRLRGHSVDVKTDFNARGDARVLTGVSMQAGQSTLSLDSAKFTSADVGRIVIVPDAGAVAVAFTGGYAENSSQITGVTTIAGYGNGSLITGSGIPAGTRIVRGAGTSTLTISCRTSGSGAGQPLVAQGALWGTIESVRGGVARLSSAADWSSIASAMAAVTSLPPAALQSIRRRAT
jgi:hypothetical protein